MAEAKIEFVGGPLDGEWRPCVACTYLVEADLPVLPLGVEPFGPPPLPPAPHRYERAIVSRYGVWVGAVMQYVYE